MEMRRFTFIFLVAAFLLPTFFVYALAPKHAPAAVASPTRQAEETTDGDDDGSSDETTTETTTTTSRVTPYEMLLSTVGDYWNKTELTLDATDFIIYFDADSSWSYTTTYYVTKSEGGDTLYVGTVADSVKQYSTDTCLIDTVYSDSTYNADWANAAVMWTFTQGTGIEAYSHLFLSLDAPSSSSVEIVVSSDGYWTGSKMKSYTLASGETSFLLDLSTLPTDSVPLDSVNLIFLRTGWVNTQTIDVNSFTLFNNYRGDYTFDPIDWVTADESRVTQDNISYDTINGTIEVSASGTNNVALSFDKDTAIYKIPADSCYLLVKGKDLSTASGASYLWWLNGKNEGSSVAPSETHTVLEDGDSDSTVYFVWKLSETGLDDYCPDNDYWMLKGSTMFGLTSLDSKATITYIGFVSANSLPALDESDKPSYYEIDITAGEASGSVTYEDGLITFASTGSDNRWVWERTGTDARYDYKYLVMVPAKPYQADQGYAQIAYGLQATDLTELYGWGFAYGSYQQRRTSVLCLQPDGGSQCRVYSTNSESDTLSISPWTGSATVAEFGTKSVSKVFVTAEGSTTNTYEISAIFMTDNTPTYYNNNWNCYYSNDGNADYTRHYSEKDHWGTVCLPYPAGVCGAYVYQPTGVNSDTTVLYLERVYGVLEAGKPYLFLNNTSTLETGLEESAVTFIKASADEADAGTNNGLVGYIDESDMTVSTSVYVLSDGVWYKGEDNTVGQYRAYLDLSQLGEASEAAKVRSIAMPLSGETATAINEPSLFAKEDTDATLDFDAAAPVYTLSGLRVTDASQPGIYIQNGKKFLVK